MLRSAIVIAQLAILLIWKYCYWQKYDWLNGNQLLVKNTATKNTMQCQMWLIIPWFLVKIRPKLPKISSEDLTKNCLKLRLKIRPKNCLILLLKIRPKNCFKIAYEDLLTNQMPVRLLPVGLLQVRLLPVDFCWSDFCQLDFCHLDFCQLDFCMSGSYDNCRLRHLPTRTFASRNKL